MTSIASSPLRVPRRHFEINAPPVGNGVDPEDDDSAQNEDDASGDRKPGHDHGGAADEAQD